MGTLGKRTRNGKRPSPRVERQERPHPALARLAVALREHKQALEQQAATAEILRAMSRSPGDAQPVFEAIVDKAHRLCDAAYSVLYRYDGKLIHLVAARDVNQKALAVIRSRYPQEPDPEKIVGRSMLEGRVFDTADIRADSRFPAAGGNIPRRAVVTVPLVHNRSVLGAISCGRAEARAFTRKEIGLLKTFADQAVIAIENARLFNETREALERQTATAEILNIISSSPTDVQPVFDGIARNAMRLLGAFSAAVTRRVGDELHLAAFTTTNEAGDEALEKNFPVLLSATHRQHVKAVLSKAPVLRTDTEAADAPATARELGRARGYRSSFVVPMLREGEAIGTIAISRREPGTFSTPQVELLKTFADQAVIAIENARLFNETREALEQQTGTSQVLSAISGSPTDVAPVYETILDNATRLCEASFAVVFLYDGEYLRAVAQRGASAAFAKHLKEGRLRPSRETATRLAALERRIVQVEDLLNDPHFAPADAHRAENARAVLSVPMLREGALIGVLTVWRREPQRFSDKQVALLKTFAEQAVIAIENVRLFNETKEALEGQTASADILRVISSTPTDSQPVFDAIVQSAQRLVAGKSAVLLLRRETEVFVAAYSIPGLDRLPPEVRTAPLDRNKNYPSRVMLDREIVHVPDWEADDVIEFEKIVGKAYGIGSGVEVPLLRKGEGIGALAVTRQTKGPFSEKEIALLQSFADQAVIAIENVRLFNETKEALEQQTAISEVLRVISDSPTDVKPVLDAVAVRAAKICEASDARIWLVEGDSVRHVAGFGDVPMPIGLGDALPLDRGTVSGRAILECAPVHVEDMAKLTREDYPISREMQERSGFRTILSVPLMREQRSLGAIMLRRLEVRSFTDKQIALLKTFADQAAIAIENVRLFNETKEALERQTATAEILRVISASPTDVQPVFDAIVQAADRLCDGRLSTVLRFDGESLDLVAHHNLSTEGLEAYRQVYPQRVSRNTMAGRALLDRKVINITDSQDDPDIPPQSRAMAVASGFRSVLVVPMLREGEPIGVLNIARAEPGSFSQAQVELLKTFADQAVIAIENVRLFNETKEALEQQTAISEILRVISDSPADVQPVVDAVAARAGRICDASDARIFLVEGETLRHAAGFGDVPMIVPLGDAMPLNRGSAMGRAVIDRAPVHVDDMQNQSADEYPQGRKVAEQAGWHTVLAVPLLREGRSLGAMVLRRMEVRSFSDKQIALLKTFADQAAIAIENVRLFNETKEALERQTATAEILKVISDSPIDVQPVFEAILARAAALCNASFGNVFRYDGAMLEMVACNLPAASIEILRKDYPSAPSRGKVSGRVVLDRQVMEIPDVLDDPEYQGTAPKAGGHRSLLGVPLLREGQAIGAIVIARHEPGRFTPRQVAMVQTFADQAVIAIENVRLFKELQARTEALSKSVGQLTALGDVGRAITSTLDLETVLKTIVQRAVQLTGLDGGSIYEYDEATEQFTLQAAENMEQELVEAVRRTPVRKGEGAIGRSAVSLEPVQVPDILDEGYRSARKEVLVRAGYRAILAVPLLQEDHVLGVILVHRKAPGPFASEVVELLKTFATQSAMAIQNARLFREIAEKGKQLEVASQHKSQFLASMSHELRTPLNALLGFNEMLLGDVYGEVPGEMQPPLAQMQSSGKHLLRLINNVLDLAKIEAGRMELALADYSVQDTVESVRSTLQPLAADKGLEFVAAVPADIPLAYGDPGRITQCLMNLAGNSLKFTKAGKVEISVTMSDGQLRYCVADTGIGIPSDKIDGLFTEFKQTDATVASEYGGTGLGLSISKKFVEMHGGRIWAQSEPGKGSVFAFEIPLRAGAT